MILGFSIYAWITMVTIVVTFGVLLFTKLRADLVFLGVIGVLFVTGVLDVNEALSGFSSTTVAVVGVMFVVVAGLNHVMGGSLIELRHFDDDKIMSPVPDREPLMGGDRLIYAGQIDELLEVKKKFGFVSADHHIFHYSEVDSDRQLRTAYITFGSSLINTKIGEGNFERNNNVTLVAVARKGKRIEQAPREVVLKGTLDTAAAREAEQVMNVLYDVEGKDIVLDCTDLDYISSAGLRIFLGILQYHEERGGHVFLRGVNDKVRDIFVLTGFNNIFEFI
jgi:anti-anti-sigma factor